MGSVIANFVPLAIGAIAPVLIVLVVLLLGLNHGLAKASAFVGGKLIAYTFMIWAVFYFGGQVQDSQGDSGQSVWVSTIKLMAGLVLIIMALKTLFDQPDPDAPPSKLQTSLQNMSPVPTFLVGFGISFLQIRFVLLMLAGVGFIRDANLGASSNIVLGLILVIVLTWPLLVPIVVYLAMGDRRGAVMNSMNAWLQKHSRVINIVVLTLIGIALLQSGLSELL